MKFKEEVANNVHTALFIFDYRYSGDIDSVVVVTNINIRITWLCLNCAWYTMNESFDIIYELKSINNLGK